jgi:hypothetical protein
MTDAAPRTTGADATAFPAAPPRPRKHLMTPGVPRPQRASSMSTATVQKWVLTVLGVVTVGHLSAGMVVAALAVPADRPVPRIGLLVIGGLIGLIAAGGVRAIHRLRIPSPWLAVGLVPALVGAYLGFWA